MRENENRKENRRIKVTKMLLKNSFIQLLKSKDISKITIKELCEHADINRSTFYAHFKDQYDLMDYIQTELIDNIEYRLSPYLKRETSEATKEMLTDIFDYIKENASICKILLSERGDLLFQKRVLSLIYGKYIGDLREKRGISKEDADYVYAYTITGSIGVIQKWLHDDMKKSSEFMAKMLLEVTAIKESPEF